MGLFQRKSLEELEEENKKLKARREIDQTFNDKRERLIRENRELKHGSKIVFVKKVGSGIASVGRSVGGAVAYAGESVAKAQREAQRRNRPTNNAPRRKRKVKRVVRRSKGMFDTNYIMS